MGGSISQEDHNQYSFMNQVNTFKNPWAGRYSQLQSFSRRTTILKKQIQLHDHQQAKALVKHYRNLQKSAFYIIDPLGVHIQQQQKICSISRIVNAYHAQIMPNLSLKIQHMRQNCSNAMNQSQIWFILSELSHSLQILYERGHPHLWISPETIYFNQNQNWFLHDLYFWQGPDYQNFLNSKMKTGELISNHLIEIIARRQIVDIRTAMDQDLYLLGYSLLYAISGVHPNSAKNAAYEILRQNKNKYSRKLIDLISSMIEQIPQRRITLQKLRYKLKVDEQKIITWEVNQYRSAHQRKRITTHYDSTTKNIQRLKTPLSSRQLDVRTYDKFGNNTDTSRYRKFYSPQYNSKRISQFRLHSPR